MTARRPYPGFPHIEVEEGAHGVIFRCWKCFRSTVAGNEVLQGTTNHVVTHKHFAPIRVFFQNAPMN